MGRRTDGKYVVLMETDIDIPAPDRAPTQLVGISTFREQDVADAESIPIDLGFRHVHPLDGSKIDVAVLDVSDREVWDFLAGRQPWPVIESAPGLNPGYIAQPNHLPISRHRPDAGYVLPLDVPAGHPAGEELVQQRLAQRFRGRDHHLGALDGLVHGVEHRGDRALLVRRRQ